MAIAVLQPRGKRGSTLAKMYPYWDTPGKPSSPVVMWAENGMVHCMDERPSTPNDRREKSVSWTDMAERVLAYSQMIHTEAEYRVWSKERDRAIRWIQAMESVLREAKEQGDPVGTSTHVAITSRVKPRKADIDLERSGLAGKPSAKIRLPAGSCDF